MSDVEEGDSGDDEATLHLKPQEENTQGGGEQHNHHGYDREARGFQDTADDDDAGDTTVTSRLHKRQVLGGDIEGGGGGGAGAEDDEYDPLHYDREKPWKRSYFPFQCFVGPDWPCMCWTYGLILGLSALWLYYVAVPQHIAVAVVGCVTGGCTVGFYSVAACSDPGIVYQVIDRDCQLPSDDRTDVRMMECSRCDMMRPINSRHCRDCNLCITDLDHHCPWTGKCIGRRTILYFKLFLCSLTAHIMLVIVSLGVSMVVAEFT